MLIIIIFIPLMLLIYTSFCFYSHSISADLTSSVAQSVIKESNNIDNLFSNIENNYNIVVNNHYVKSCLTQPHTGYDTFYSADNKLKTYEIIKNYIICSNYIHSVSIYNLHNNEVYSSYDGGDYNNIYDKAAYAIFENTGNGNYVTYRDAVFPQYKSNQFITLSREIRYSTELDGIIIINISVNSINDHFSFNNETDEIFVVDNNRNIIYNSNSNKSENPIDSYPSLTDLYEKSNENGFVSIIENKYLACSVKMLNHPWVVIKKVSIQTLSTKLSQIKLTGIGIAILILFISFILASLISLRFYKSIIKIIYILQNPTCSSLKESDSKNEVFFIIKNILSIIDKNSKIQNELASRLALLRKAQSIALQTQINPHFLFNTLQLANIISISTLKKDNDVSKILSLLSELLRIALNTKDTLISIRTEIEYTKKYLEIQNIKYKNRYHSVWNIDENTLDCKIIKLTLQPLIENCIFHGINPTQSEGIIEISSVIKNEILHISVYDNGVGIIESRYKEILEILDDQNIKENSSIGLSNVNQRIKLIFGSKYGVNIEPMTQGTKIIINIPIIR